MRDALPQPAWLIVLVLAIAMPYVFSEPGTIAAGTDAIVLFLGALSLVPLLGWLRVLTLAPPASAGAAAYVCSVLLVRQQSLPVAAIAGMAIGALVAVIAVLPVLRTAARQLAWSSLVVSLLVWAVLQLRGSAPGLVQPVFVGIDLSAPRAVYMVGVIGATLAVVAILRVARSRDGRLLAAAGVAHDYAVRCGGQRERMVLIASALSGAIAGTAGVVASLQPQGASAAAAFPPVEVLSWIGLALLGGAGWPSGVLLGALVATALAALTPLTPLAIGALALAAAVLANRSLVGVLRPSRRQQPVAR